MSTLFHFSPRVAQAMASQNPVVALESTVITHGLPYPANLETALAMEEAVRDGGATPATIAIVGGRVHVGLSVDQLRFLAELPADQARKCSWRDLPIALAGHAHGSTTVAATMWLAYQAGLQFFATGGIGGVHRGHPFDVSADLTALGSIPITVVCSGAKAILDLPATREKLETHGVTLIGFQSDSMAAFYSRASGLPVDIRAESPADVARIVRARQIVGLPAASLVTVPVPADVEVARVEIEAIIQQATKEAEAAGVVGGASTPWLLNRVSALSHGASQRANIALLVNNAHIAAEIALAYAQM